MMGEKKSNHNDGQDQERSVNSARDENTSVTHVSRARKSC